MMKQKTFLTSAILCVIMGYVGNAYSAASVRVLGTPGTVVGTSSAVAAKTNAVSSVDTSVPVRTRTSSVRLTPKVSTSTGNAKSTTVESASGVNGGQNVQARLSIGKYLNRVKPSGTSGGGSVSGDEITEINNRITNIENQITNIQQPVELEAGDFINIDSDDNTRTVSIDVDELKEEVSTLLDNCEIVMQLTEDAKVRWRYKTYSESSFNKNRTNPECPNSGEEDWHDFANFNIDEDIVTIINNKLDDLFVAGKGINITSTVDGKKELSVKVDNDTIKFDGNGALTANYTDNDTTYGAGEAITVDEDNKINVNVDGTSIKVVDNKLVASGGVEYNAGENVQINNGVISAIDTKYFGGDAVTIDGDNKVNVNVDGTSIKVVGNKLVASGGVEYTAGDNISIEDNKISATDTDTTYNSGVATEIGDGNKINVKYDNDTITVNEAGELVANAGVEYTAGSGIEIAEGNVIKAAAAGGNGILVTDGTGDNAGKKVFSVNADGSTIDIDETTGQVYAVEMAGATGDTAGKSGVVPASEAGDQDKVLTAGGQWVEQTVDTNTEYKAGNDNVVFGEPDEYGVIPISSVDTKSTSADTSSISITNNADYTQSLDVKVDGTTIVKNAGGALLANIDNNTIKYEEGKGLVASGGHEYKAGNKGLTLGDADIDGKIPFALTTDGAKEYCTSGLCSLVLKKDGDDFDFKWVSMTVDDFE